MDRTLMHETWGDHSALIARSKNQGNHSGSVGKVHSENIDVATPTTPLRLQYGEELLHVTIAYQAYGELNKAGDNAILICHALTGSAHAAGFYEPNGVPGWWDPLIGPGKAIDTNKHFVVCSNVLGGCYGSTGPSSINPRTGQPYHLSFPRYTIRDMVTVQHHLAETLGISSWKSAIGGSMGGMQALEWAATYPEQVRSVIPIGIGARHSAWAIGLNEVARRAITSDPMWQEGNYASDKQPEAGLGLARAIAMLSYRSMDSLEAKFGRERVNDTRNLLGVSFQIESYLKYQGVKLVKRFDANTYLYITRAMDDYDLSEGRGRIREVLRNMKIPALCIGISSDVLYFESEIEELVKYMQNARYFTLNSPHGHDAFLIEFPQLAVQLRRFLAEVK